MCFKKVKETSDFCRHPLKYLNIIAIPKRIELGILF
uniref:Uncharacterized protein n=1 Tax=Lepeophtheirus salmonis TaxID=72036 RepID=A0A0K2T0G8_LEPSM